MFEEYLENKNKEIQNMTQRELIEYMYKNGMLLEVEYEKYISLLEEQEESENDR